MSCVASVSEAEAPHLTHRRTDSSAKASSTTMWPWRGNPPVVSSACSSSAFSCCVCGSAFPGRSQPPHHLGGTPSRGGMRPCGASVTCSSSSSTISSSSSSLRGGFPGSLSIHASLGLLQRLLLLYRHCLNTLLCPRVVWLCSSSLDSLLRLSLFNHLFYVNV